MRNGLIFRIGENGLGPLEVPGGTTGSARRVVGRLSAHAPLIARQAARRRTSPRASLFSVRLYRAVSARERPRARLWSDVVLAFAPVRRRDRVVRSRLQKPLAHTRGATIVEYALMLLLVLVVAALTIKILGNLTSRSNDQATMQFGS